MSSGVQGPRLQAHMDKEGRRSRYQVQEHWNCERVREELHGLLQGTPRTGEVPCRLGWNDSHLEPLVCGPEMPDDPDDVVLDEKASDAPGPPSNKPADETPAETDSTT